MALLVFIEGHVSIHFVAVIAVTRMRNDAIDKLSASDNVQ
jgi:hypothetical protein